MARYIDAELAIEKCNKLIDNADSCPNPYAIEGVRVVRNVILSECETGVPTADVVPKSEVDKTIAEWAYLHADVLNKLENAKAEVAREIFEEIESLLTLYTYEDNYGDYISTGLADEFAELKKKYTEEPE